MLIGSALMDSFRCNQRKDVMKGMYTLKEETFAIFGKIRESLFPRNICYL